MVQSLNTKSELVAVANSFHSAIGAKHGNIMIGDRAFEFFNERNVRDFIQIPWSEIKLVKVHILFGKFIRSFAIVTNKGTFYFTAPKSGKILKAMTKHVDTDKMVKTIGPIRKIQKYLEIRKENKAKK